MIMLKQCFRRIFVSFLFIQMEVSPVTPKYVLFFPVNLGKGAIFVGKTKRVVWLRKDKLVIESGVGGKGIVSQVSYDDSLKLAPFFEEGLVNEMYCRPMTQWQNGSQPCFFCVKIPNHAQLDNFYEQIRDLGYRVVKHNHYPWGSMVHQN